MEWWKERVIYQIYPRSFADSNADGIGDLKGITSKLDYLKDLGIGAIWLSPHYPSPFLDCGYDISDYSSVGSEYGSMEDFKEFLQEAHNRDIKVILDLVLNHTSDKHPWFIESKSSIDNPKRDWYVWEKNSGSFPNDWQSCFRGPAWTLDEKTDEYYYHFFLKEQPDLNWRNPELKEAMFNVMRFWLDLGVDGYRIDAISSIFEDENLTNQGMTPEGFSKSIKESDDEFLQHDAWEHYMRHQIKQPELFELLKEIRLLADSYTEDKFLVGELSYPEYMGDGTDQLHMVFNFPLMQDGIDKISVIKNQRKRLPLHPKQCYQGNTLSNHDQPRIRSRYGNNDIEHQALKQAIFLLLTLKGTPYLYYGDEIGLKDYTPESLDDFMDLKSVNLYYSSIKDGKTPDEALEIAKLDTRDKCRTPMPWDNRVNAGFSAPGVKTWLPIDPEYKNGINVADELKDKNSILNYYKSIIKFRNGHKTLQYGEYLEINSEDDDLLIFKRIFKFSVYQVIINYSNDNKKLKVNDTEKYKLIFGTTKDYDGQVIKAGAAIILSVT
ncbi:MAG: alpha-amylase family glycosyl hydrolase [Spirochaetaceae bacterium]